MFRPFDHVTIGTMEFVLTHKNTRESFSDTPNCEWYAKDEYGNKVGIVSTNMVKIPVQGYEHNVPVKNPVFFRERGNQRIRMELPDVLRDIIDVKTSGRTVDVKYTRWDWNIEDLTIKNNNETWLLRVFTPGGWWL
jgi:hypothetical protein